MLASPFRLTAPFSPTGPKNTSEDSLSFRPARDVDAFNSLLPPPIEFVEGSSSGTLAVPEGRYQPINVSPKLSAKDRPDATCLRHKSPASPTATQIDITARSPTSVTKNLSLSVPGVDLAWPETCDRAVGLYNTGNTCFLNSALQCLLHTPPLLRSVIAHNKEKCRTGDKFCMICSFKQVVVQAHKTSATPFAPLPVSNRLQTIAKHMRRGRQEDSHEFLRYAIDAMQKSLMHGHPQKLEVELSETTFVHKVFGGKLRSRVSCESCGYNSDTFDRILDLSLDIIKADSLKEALSSFISPDHLKGTDKYKCEKCKKHVNAEKRFTIHEAPAVLTVHLKRFSPLGRKIGHHVMYDETLNLQPYMSKGAFGPTYSLYGVICHAGGGPNSGHYFAFVKSRTGKWYEMNDEIVSPHHGPPLNKKTAYILFYIRNKGQGLQAVVKSSLNGIYKEKESLTSRMKKRNWEREDNNVDEDGEDDVGERVDSPRGNFIGPLLPSPMDKSSPSIGSPIKKAKTHHHNASGEELLKKVDPQAEKIKQKIKAVKAADQVKATRALAVLESYDSSDINEDKEQEKEKELENTRGNVRIRAIVESDQEEEGNDKDADVDVDAPLSRKLSSPSPSSRHVPSSSPIPSADFYGVSGSKVSGIISCANGTQLDDKSDKDDDKDEDDKDDYTPSSSPKKLHSHRCHLHHHHHHHNDEKSKKHKKCMAGPKVRASMDANGMSQSGSSGRDGHKLYVSPFNRFGSENSVAARHGRMNTYGKRRGRVPRGL